MTQHPAIPPYDGLVLGGGPAGCAAAILLARRGHRVGLVRPLSPPASALAESIPPSARRVLEELGALGAVEDAGFHPNRGNSVWWGEQPLRRETFADDAMGFHTDRGSLEDVLAIVAERAGVRVHGGVSARAVERAGDVWSVRGEGPGGTVHLRARWLVDATGRHGLLARADREPDRTTTTLAIVRRWHRPGGWPDDEAHHTMVESYADGWAWSVPISSDVRCVTAMIDQRHADLGGASPSDMLDRELDKTRHVGRLREGAEPRGDAWACPASLYTSRRFAREGVLIAGDAGSFIDPLSSFGVKKALSSGWLAGVVVHTALVDPGMAVTALDFFDRREREVYRRYRAISADFFAEAAEVYGTEYWIARAEAAHQVEATSAQSPRSDSNLDVDPDRLETEIAEADVRRAFERIRALPRLEAARGSTLRTLERPAIEGYRVKLQDHLATDACSGGVRFVRGVDLRQLVEIAPRHGDVPDGWAAYNGVAPPVTLPDYLTALATAFAVGVLEHDEA
ncbi:MAG: tryptophan 7-halogenase [Gemmatimonadota bacterium]